MFLGLFQKQMWGSQTQSLIKFGGRGGYVFQFGGGGGGRSLKKFWSVTTTPYPIFSGIALSLKSFCVSPRLGTSQMLSTVIQNCTIRYTDAHLLKLKASVVNSRSAIYDHP